MATSKKAIAELEPTLIPDTSVVTKDTPVVETLATIEVPIITAEEVAAAQANADALFNAANENVEARVTAELAVQTMTNEELDAAFGFTLSEAISVLDSTIHKLDTPFKDKMLSLLDQIKNTSELI